MYEPERAGPQANLKHESISDRSRLLVSPSVRWPHILITLVFPEADCLLIISLGTVRESIEHVCKEIIRYVVIPQHLLLPSIWIDFALFPI